MPGLIYTMDFKNVEGTLVKVIISDTRAEEAEIPVVYVLDPAGSPLKLVTVDNEESKFAPIKAQQAIITFLSNGETSLQTFSDGPDDRFKVTVIYGSQIVFYGFLSLSDNQEAFLPARNEVTLTANDKLGALKDIAFTDFDNFNPQGKYPIGRILQMCLQKTGLDLPIRVINNLRHGTGSKTFMATFGSPSAPFILMDNANTQFFYVGQRVVVTGTALNNVEFTVVSVNTGFVGVIGADVNFTIEADVVTTFTDMSSDEHIYQQFLDAKTFEESIGVSENCYDVIRKILGFDCFITQYNGEWWICRIDEYAANPLYVTRFDENGDFVDRYTEGSLNKNIGFNQTHWLSNERTNILPTRPIGFAKLTYNFENPIELMCNQDFDRGDFIEDLPDETNADGVTEQVKKYELDCWDYLSRLGGGAFNVFANYNQAPLPSADMYVKRFYFFNAETHRELVIKAAPGSGAGVPYIQSSGVKVSYKDVINLSVSVFYSNIGGGSGYFNSPVLVGLFSDTDPDVVYWWKAYNVVSPNDPQTWVLSSVTSLAIPTGSVYPWYVGANVEDPPLNMSFTSPPLPVSGTLRVFLINEYGDEYNAHYSIPNLSVNPFINGSYQTYKGRYDKVTRDEDGYLAKVEGEVFISDAERELFKGAMFFLNDTTYKLTSKWYNAALFSLGSPTDNTFIKPYGKHQVFSVWNQYRLANIIFQFQFQGFGSDIPSLVHKFSTTDVSWASVNRYFLMLTKEADLFLCEMTGTLEQVYHTIEQKDYESPHEFKYIN